MGLCNRLRKLESRVLTDRYMALFDNQGKCVDAIIQKMPGNEIGGLALMPDGSSRGIYPLASVAELILGTADHQGETQESVGETLFLRINDIRCGAEILLGSNV